MNKEIHHLNFKQRPGFTKRPKLSSHHLLYKITASGVPAGQSEGLITSLSVRSNLTARSHLSQRLHLSHNRGKRILSNLLPILKSRSNAKGLHIKPIVHPILIPLILLTRRDLQPRIPLLPLRHERTTAILRYKLIFTHLLRLALKLIVFAESVQIRLSAIGLASPANLTQSKQAIRSKLVNLHIELLQHLMKKSNGRIIA
jgi:hypothetical protein